MKHKLIEEASGKEVKPGMTLLDFYDNIWVVISFRANEPLFTSKIRASSTDVGVTREFFASELGLKVVEAE